MRDETFNIRMTLRIFCSISYYFSPFMSDLIFHSSIVRSNFGFIEFFQEDRH